MTTLRNLQIVVLAALAWPAVHGCTPVDGGAVEASWNLRSIAGTDLGCEESGVDRMRLVVDDMSFSFDCERARGVTGFDITPGEVAIHLTPLCANGDAPPEGTYRSPPPIVRTITEGDVITLETQLIEIGPDACN